MVDILTNVSDSEKFNFWDSTNAKNVRELHKKIKIMSPYVFSMYVNNQKNEFAKWVEKNYNDKNLAKQISACPRKGEILDCLSKAIDQTSEQKNAKIDGLINKKEKMHDQLLKVVSNSKPSQLASIPFVAEKPFFSSLFKKYNSNSENKLNPEFIPLKPLEKPKEKENILSSRNQVALPLVPLSPVSLKDTQKSSSKKRVLLDEVIEAGKERNNEFSKGFSSDLSKIPFTSTLKSSERAQRPTYQNNSSNSNVFKQESPSQSIYNFIKARPIQAVSVNEIIEHIKGVHR